VKAVILAAGRGSRLKELTDNTPKPMLMLRDGSPLLEMIVCGIRDAGVSEFVIITGYLGEQIREWFGDGSQLGIGVQYIEQKEINGTGGAVRSARSAVGDDVLVMSFGDILISPHNYKRLVDGYKQNPAESVMMVNAVEDPCAGSAVYFDDEFCVEKIIEKPPKGTSTSNWNQAGISLFEPVVFEYLEKIPLSARGEYEIVDAVQMMIHDGLTVRALPLEGFWSDIGTPDDVESVQQRFRNYPTFLSD
jgi:NDP-sugar pyrophosphorylase family protein